MIDRKLRKQLSQDLRRLVTGRMTNDAFDDVYYDRYSRSEDAAVDRIANFGYCLYSSDLLLPLRLRGRHAVSPATRRTVARCVLFLRTSLDYHWPKEPSSIAASLVASLANMGLPAGIALLICSVPLLLGGIRDVEFLWPIAASGLLILVASVWYLTDRRGLRAAYYSAKWRAWRSSGDFDVWPFRNREDFYDARRTAHLLGTGSSVELC